MFWRFGFSSTSTLETLLDKPNVTVEEVLDEDDLLQECKAQNQKLITYLQQPRVLKRLLEHVVGTARVGGSRGREWEEKVKFKYPYMASEVLSCEIWAIAETILSDPSEYLVPFWNSVLTSRPGPSQAPVPLHSHPLFADSANPSSHLGVTNLSDFASSDGRHSSDSESSPEPRLRAVTAQENGPGPSVLAGYWAKVNGVFLEKKPAQMLDYIRQQPKIVERFVAHLETPAVVDLLFRIIQMEESLPSADVIDWLSSHELISRTVDLLAPNYSVDLHNTVSELLKAIIALSAPSPASLGQAQAGDATGVDVLGPQQIGGMNNLLVRELASESIVKKMVAFMLDSQFPNQLHRRLTDAADEQLSKMASVDGTGPKFRRPSTLRSRLDSLSTLAEDSSSLDSAIDDDDDLDAFVRPLNPREFPASESRSPGTQDHRDSTATVRPENFFPPVSAPTVPVTKETCSSTLVTCIGVFIELIRKNNSDYFEQHLLRTLHNHLVQRQAELAEKRAEKATKNEAAETSGEEDEAQTKTDAEGQQDEEDDEMGGMEEAMAEIVDKLGLVHLGPMLQVLSERLPEFQRIVADSRESTPRISTTVGEIIPLTFERYRITELYAELLHCSNMALLNRGPGEGPQYSNQGILMGGIEGLQILARILQGGDGPEVPEAIPSHDFVSQLPEPSTTDDIERQGDTAVSAMASDQAKPEETDSATAENAEPIVESHPSPSRHKREQSTTGDSNASGVSEDTEDEALLNEVSLSEKPAPTQEASDPNEPSTLEVQPLSEGIRDDAKSPQVTIFDMDDPIKLEEDDDARSIRSAVSGLSLAELTCPQLSGPPSPIDDSKEYVVGDFLKKRFLDCGIIPSLLDLFFGYPWNNFLHNVVYDILQQFFNGRMDVGLNRKLTVAVFEQGSLTEKIVQGRAINNDSVQSPRKIRLGYMGHMNLIVEETVKLLERYPLEVARPVSRYLEDPLWEQVVGEILEEIREKEGGPLAFVRPSGASMSFGMGDDDGQLGAGSSSFASYLSSQIGGAAGGSDDDDSDEETSWLSHDISSGSRGSGFDDAFTLKGDSVDQDDEWGPFADPSGSNEAEEQTFDFPQTSTSSTNPFSQNLTPADWSAQFRREGMPTIPIADDDGEDNEGNDSSADDDDDDDDDSNKDGDGDTPFVDLLDPSTLKQTDIVAAVHARRPSLSQLEAQSSLSPLGLIPSTIDLSGSSAPAGVDTEAPLGPGVPADVEQRDDGMVQRTFSDGTTIVVPGDAVDELALSSSPPSSSSSSDCHTEKPS